MGFARLTIKKRASFTPSDGRARQLLQCLWIQLGWRGYRARTRRCGRYWQTGLLARAIQATVFAADPAGLFQAGAQGLAGSVQTNREIALRDLQFLSNAFRRFALEIDSPDDLGIIRM